MTPEKENAIKAISPPFETVENLEQLGRIIMDLNINKIPVIVFLDFDGALSNNILMRVRQAQVAYKYAHNFIHV
ncbi:hypothetical protein HYT18_03950 [Candidatus Microgenomates bacterium]|nr:hypothetical protein [Candidatus Microgenomates bacterium]